MEAAVCIPIASIDIIARVKCNMLCTVVNMTALLLGSVPREMVSVRSRAHLDLDDCSVVGMLCDTLFLRHICHVLLVPFFGNHNSATPLALVRIKVAAPELVHNGFVMIPARQDFEGRPRAFLVLDRFQSVQDL